MINDTALLESNKKLAELNQRNWNYRTELLENICEQEFQLVYFGHFNYSEIDEMTVIERNMIFGLLIKQKKEEQKQYEDSKKE